MRDGIFSSSMPRLNNRAGWTIIPACTRLNAVDKIPIAAQGN